MIDLEDRSIREPLGEDARVHDSLPPRQAELLGEQGLIGGDPGAQRVGQEEEVRSSPRW